MDPIDHTPPDAQSDENAPQSPRSPEADNVTSVWTPGAGDPSLPVGGRAAGGSDLDPDHFATGTVLLDRYRIIRRIGGGGMGTVYSADDTQLGEPVALKFLSAKLSDDAAAVALLRNEVRIARQVSHPHVCRVHDLGELGGRPFLSMEFVDGEDLGSLLRRIGRVPADKANELARQICAGLNAAHERGVLHRDLKPQNIIVDEEGDAKIVDFGIASLVESHQPTGGTPTYMAPELFAGSAPSVRSDLYSLGLLLYELYTGRQLHRAKSMTELLAAHRKPVVPPAVLAPDVPPAVEQVILRCLEREAQHRPASALTVLAALPGSDALAESLASGHTPSPELVAASGSTGGLSLVVGGALVGLIAVLLLAAIRADCSIKLLARAHLPYGPQVLTVKAREHLQAIGWSSPSESAHSGPAYLGPARSEAVGFAVDHGHLRQINRHMSSRAQWDQRLAAGRPAVIDFWFRSAQTPLMARNVKGQVRWDDPPVNEPGMIQMRLDPEGRLRELIAVPMGAGIDPAVDATPPPPADQDSGPWPQLLAAAGLDMAQTRRVRPARLPTRFADQRAAFVGTYPGTTIPIRIEMAALGSTPIAFRIIEQRFPDQTGPPPPRERRHQTTWRHAAQILLLLSASWLAWTAFRQRRGDFQGAFRVGFAVFVAVVAFTVLTGDHGSTWTTIGELVLKGMSHGLGVAAMLSLFYYALEPAVRRIWPQSVISWSRLVAGRWLDPLVGQHVLLGLLFGVMGVLVLYGRWLLPRWAGVAEPPPLLLTDSALELLAGSASATGAILELAVDLTREALKFFMGLVLLRLVLRRLWLAGAATVLIWTAVWSSRAWEDYSTGWIFASCLLQATSVTVQTLVLVRAGFLSFLVMFLTFGLLATFRLHLDLQSWFSGSTVVALLLVAVCTLWGVVAATGPSRRSAAT